MTHIVLNGESRPVEGPMTVAALIGALGCGHRGVAVAVNEEVAPRSLWPQVLVQPGDRVEVLKAAQGG